VGYIPQIHTFTFDIGQGGKVMHRKLAFDLAGFIFHLYHPKFDKICIRNNVINF
jgi:hypothetical protein